MTTDLSMLVASALLCFFLPFIHNYSRVRAGGLAWALGNRDSHPNVPAWSERAVRTHQNFVESLPIFAVLVLTAHVAGRANDLTATGAVVFFLPRVGHTVAYIAGSWLRTFMWYIGVAGQAIILSQLW